MPSPDLPTPAPFADSMLTRKFGREVANYFSGSTLNRLSFLRDNNAFLSAALAHPSAQLVLLNSLAPLAHSPSALAFTRRAEVKSLLGEEDPYKLKEDEMVNAFDSRITKPQLIFLGLDEGYDAKGEVSVAVGKPAIAEDAPASGKDSASTSASASTHPPPFTWTHNHKYSGQPFFALDITPSGSFASAAEAFIKQKEADGLVWLQGRMHMNFPANQAAIYAEARSLADWNSRNPFCAGCGQPTLSVNGGFKRTCPPTDFAGIGGASGTAGSTETPQDNPSSSKNSSPLPRPACATRGRISNLSFPRTDPTIIVAVLSADSQRILLGRQRKWPPHWYSTLAGFVEPAESVEEAVRREVWEEAGIALGRVQVHSTQPWPYPASLMIGAVAQALPGGEEIRLDNDPELEDARWYGIEEVREALQKGVGSLEEMDKVVHEEYKGLRLPPKTAIANRLITAVVEGYAGAVGRL